MILLVLGSFPLHLPQYVCGLEQKKGDLETAQSDKRAKTLPKIWGSHTEGRKGGPCAEPLNS